jgi:pimeloyl-ACP methyl ester carboxylesterase
VASRMDGPVDLVAQSMGGVIAARLAISRPEMVRRLVLVATSGGIDMVEFDAADWRPGYRKLFPNAAEWILEKNAVAAIPVENIAVPTLLLWGTADEISPVEVGRYLELRMPHAKLHIVGGGDHDLASNKADLVAGLIRRHLE